ncbi:transposase [Streptomyces sp. NBC_01390]|uniref:integrase core domain-containing protein n=1 Tax=Streptomyces sp. NBC_01390 TaxID=2903850 RepID=UPI0032430B4C
MDLEDVGAHAAYLIRERDAKYPALIDETLADVGIQSVFTGDRMPRMNSIVERWVLSLRCELLDRILIWNAHDLRHALSERFYNEHRTHRSLQAAAPLRALPETITGPREIARLDIRRHDRLGGVIHEYQQAA